MSNPLNGILGSSGGGSGGSGDVVGPASSTDFGIAYFDDTTGKLLASSAATITAAGSLTIPSAETIEFSTDTGLARSAAGVVKITDGGAGFGDLKISQTLSTNASAMLLTSAAASQTAGVVLYPASTDVGRFTSDHGLELPSTLGVKWSSNANTSSNPDTGLAREAAGVIRVTDGSTGRGILYSSVHYCRGGIVLQPSTFAGAYNDNDTNTPAISIYPSATGPQISFAQGANGILWSASSNADNAIDLKITRVAAGGLGVFNNTNGMANNIKIATTTVNASGATSAATNLVPAGCILLGVTTRVTTAITSGDGGTGVNIGNGTDADMYGAAIAFTLGTTTNLTNHTASALAFKSAAESVVFTCVGGTFSGGVWRVAAHYLDLSAATS